MLPDIASSISESVGCGLRASSAEADMIWPDWQYPHCTTSRSSQAFWILAPAAVAPDGLDGRDLGGADAVDRGDTRPGGVAVDMHRAGTAQRHAAAELGARHAEHVAQHPQERGVAVNVDRPVDAIDPNRGGHRDLQASRVDRACGRQRSSLSHHGSQIWQAYPARSVRAR